MKNENDNKNEEIKTCEYTGKNYKGTIRAKCDCICHRNPSVIHFAPCCDNGWIDKRVYID